MKKLIWGSLAVVVLSACGGTEAVPAEPVWLESDQQCVSQGVSISFTGMSAKDGCATLARDASPDQSVSAFIEQNRDGVFCCGQTCDCSPSGCSCGPITCTNC
jgi:hypothetical protein